MLVIMWAAGTVLSLAPAAPVAATEAARTVAVVAFV